jgi:serine/alanine adding enzyme
MIGVKHTLDRVLAFVGLVLLSPLFVAIALWVLVESGSPVLVRQPRAGKDGRPFRMLKFRTMVPDAVEAGRRLGLDDPYGILPDDPRITRSGRFLRRTSFDELPQLWNVLCGEMSLVGPRPDLVEQVANYAPAERRRLAVRPGITGWSQIQGRDEITWPERFEHDAWYVEHWSVSLDTRILLRTFAKLFRPEPTPVEDTMNIERGRAPKAIAEVGAEAWDGVLDEVGCRDVYLRHGFVEASCLLDGGRPVLLHVADGGGQVVFPCSVRSVPGSEELRDVTTPYGYGGPVAAGPSPPLERFWELYEAWCAENAVVTTFLRFHPLLGNHRLAGPPVHLEPLAATFGWRLDGHDDLAESMHRHHRRAVRKAVTRVEIEVRERPEQLDDFAALYEATMRRQSAEPFYFFPDAYWDALAAGLRDALVRFDGLVGGEMVASVLCLASPPWLHYHLGGTLEPARSLGASNLLMLAAARWGREGGYEEFHLGGGVGGRTDSLWEYKRRFAPGGEREAWIGKMVHDERAYLELAGAESVELGGFFPAYRAARSLASRPASR